jgi:hypothetical protein
MKAQFIRRSVVTLGAIAAFAAGSGFLPLATGAPAAQAAGFERPRDPGNGHQPGFPATLPGSNVLQVGNTGPSAPITTATLGAGAAVDTRPSVDTTPSFGPLGIANP